MSSQNTGNAISETQVLKISWGAAVLGSNWQFCPTTEESLKNWLSLNLVTHLPLRHATIKTLYSIKDFIKD
jgi:hypothetical protein